MPGGAGRHPRAFPPFFPPLLEMEVRASHILSKHTAFPAPQKPLKDELPLLQLKVTAKLEDILHQKPIYKFTTTLTLFPLSAHNTY